MKKANFHKTVVISFIAIAFVSVAMTGAIWVQSKISEFNTAIEEQRLEQVRHKQRVVQHEVEGAYKLISEYRELSRAGFEKSLRREQKNLISTIRWLMERQATDPLEKKKADTISLLKDYLLREECFGVFVIDENQNVLLWKVENNQQDAPLEKSVIAGIVRGAYRESQEPFRLLDIQSTEGDVWQQRLVLAERYQPLDWYVGVVGFANSHELKVQQKILSMLNRVFVSESDYLFVGTWDGLSLIGPGAGKNVLTESDGKTAMLVEKLIRFSKQGGGFIEYELPPVSSQNGQTKLSYLVGIPDWKWYLGAGVLMNDLAGQIEVLEQKKMEQVLRNIVTIVSILIGLLVIAIVLSRKLSQAVAKDLDQYALFIQRAVTDEAQTDPQHYRYKEFAQLAEAGNQMVKERLISQGRFKRLTEGSPMPMVITQQTGEIVFLNPAFTAFLGYELADIPTIDACFEKIYPDSEYRQLLMDEWLKEIRAADIEKGTIGPKEVVMTSKSGEEKVVEISAAMDGNDLIVVINDLTDRIASEEAQQRSEKLFRTVFDNVPVGIMLNDQDEFRIVEVNNALCDIIGLERKQLIGKSPADFVADADEAKKVVEVSNRIRFKHDYPLRFSFTGRKASGDTIDVETIATGIFDENGEFLNGLALIWDETERNQLQERLRQSEKLQAIGQLAGGVAHDFNNQLGGILGFAELLLLQLEDEQLRNYAKSIMDASQRAGALTGQLLAFARKGKFKTVTVDLAVVISDVIDILRHTIDKRIIIQQKLSVKQGFVNGDPAQIQNALLNLAINARDAMKDGGQLMFALDNISLNGSAHINGPFDIPPGEYIKLSVSDTGIGMSDDVKKRIFEPFFTTKPAGRGTGMGLAAVYGTAKAHQGYITVESRPGRGSRFDLYLPAAGSTLITEDEIGDIYEGVTGRVLLIDDESLILDVATQTLENKEFEVEAFSGSEEALAYYKLHWKDVSVIILDMIMPGMSGIEVWHHLKAINPDAKVIISSGYSVKGDAQKILDEGGKAFLQKPFRLDVLTKTVAKVMTESDNAPS